MQQFLSDHDSGCLDLKPHHLVLAIAKKTLGENQFKHALKMTYCTHPISRLVTKYSLKEAAVQMGTKVGGELVTGMSA